MTLMTDLDAYYLDHHQCYDLDAGVNGHVVWIEYSCGALMARQVEEPALASND